MARDVAKEIKEMQPEKEFFIGIDSDGCAFDSMEPKHKECFCPTFIWKWNLEAVSKFAREVWDFVNLYSKLRGCDRFLALQHSLNFLRERKEVIERGVDIPELPELKHWTETAPKLGNATLKEEIERGDSDELKRVLDWSEGIDEAVERIIRNVPPFPQLKGCLAKAAEKADMVVISSTPLEALEREWTQHGIAQYMRAIAGKELGKKDAQLATAAGGKYPTEKMMMIGDAYSDMKAGKANDTLFYPIIPGHEEESWTRFQDEALDRFFAGTYAGEYEQQLIADLDKALPEAPPWK